MPSERQLAPLRQYWNSCWGEVSCGSGPAWLAVAVLLVAISLGPVPVRGEEAPTRGPQAPEGCASSEQVDLRREATFSNLSNQEDAHERAVRRAVIDALQQIGGADIARSSQTATTSTRSTVERERREHLVVRSGGRVTDWRILSEEVHHDENGVGGMVRLELRVSVCVDPAAPPALVIAIDRGEVASPSVASEIRVRLAEAIATYGNFDVRRELPSEIYHDIRVELDQSVEIREVDNSDKAAILQNFGASEMLDEAALRFQLVSVTTTARAVRFVDEASILQTVERRRRIPLDARPASTIDDLLLETSAMAAANVGERLGAGALDYSAR